MARFLVSTLTLAILIGYGLALRSAANAGMLWWALPLGFAVTAVLYFLVTDKNERRAGNAEMMDNFRRWRRAICVTRPR